MTLGSNSLGAATMGGLASNMAAPGTRSLKNTRQNNNTHPGVMFQVILGGQNDH